jgi:hypothetical protein
VRTADTQAAAGDVSGARESYARAVALGSEGSAADRGDEARYAIAGAYEGLARLEVAAAGASPKRIAAACDWFARSDHERTGIREIGALSPNGFYLQASERQRPRPVCVHQHASADSGTARRD